MSLEPDQPKTIWDDIFSAAWAAIEGTEGDPRPSDLEDRAADEWEPFATRLDKDISLAIISAGSGLAGQIYTKFPDAYPKELTFENAVTFAEVFVMAMTSRWVRHICDKDAKFDRATMWFRLSHDLLALFGTYSFERHEDARLADIQFNTFMDLQSRGEHWIGYAFSELEITMWLAARSLRSGPVKRLVPSAIPAAGSYELMSQADIEPYSIDLTVITEVQNLFLSTEAGMYAFFNALQVERQKAD